MKIIKDIAISENGLIFNPITGDSFKVNDIGIEILKLMRMNIEPEEIKDILYQKYEVENKILEIDFNDFINCMSRHQLLQGESKQFDFGD